MENGLIYKGVGHRVLGALHSLGKENGLPIDILFCILV